MSTNPLDTDVALPFDPRIEVRMILACGMDYEIGYDGRLPWRTQHPSDYQFFRRKTLSSPVIMGRKTYVSIPGGLDNRHLYIMTKNRSVNREDLDLDEHLVHNWESAIREAVKKADTGGQKHVYIAGGAQIYQQALDYDLVDRMYLTIFGDTYEADTYFEPDMDGYKITEFAEIEADEFPDGTRRVELIRYGLKSDREKLWKDRAAHITE